MIDLRFDPLPWADRAACLMYDPEMFFPRKGRGGDVRRAKAICRGCPVQVECRAYALGHHEAFGVWGGLSEFDRRRIRHRQRQAA